jgi:hypothetical protein
MLTPRAYLMSPEALSAGDTSTSVYVATSRQIVIAGCQTIFLALESPTNPTKSAQPNNWRCCAPGTPRPSITPFFLVPVFSLTKVEPKNVWEWVADPLERANLGPHVAGQDSPRPWPDASKPWMVWKFSYLR